jgi:MFS transporter, YNFM family, putative membrane transport protein
MTAHALRLFAIAAISFLTLVDLFATQAILPALARSYNVRPSVIGPAVNACTFGMALAGIAVAWASHRINRRTGVSVCLALLAIPTLLLATMPDLPAFAALRVAQGVFMSAAFSLTIAYLAENCTADEAASALAAYVTGNVASNLFGRLMSAAVADSYGLGTNFVFFAALNLAGAMLAYTVLRSAPQMTGALSGRHRVHWGELFRQPDLAACFAIGFLILFTFIGTFTYVNFVLTGPISLSQMQLGLVYLVFVPSIIATPLAGRTALHFGARNTIIAALALASAGLPFLAQQNLTSLLAGLVLVALGTFFAQATATAYVGRAAGEARGSAGGIYLASYYTGGLAGSFVLGQVFDSYGWTATVWVIGGAFSVAAGLSLKLADRKMLAHS